MSDRIKVLRLIARLNIGGPATHVILLTQGLPQEKYESLLVTGLVGVNEGDMFYHAEQKGIRPYCIKQLKREIDFFRDFIAFLKIWRVISKWSPDIVHTHTAKAGMLGRLAVILHNLFCLSAGKKIKTVHTFHGHIFKGYFSKYQNILFIFLECVLAIFTNKIITVSNSVKRELVDLRICNPDKITVIPLGFDLETFMNVSSRSGKVLNIGMVGRLVPIKNHRMFFDAISKVIEENHDQAIEVRIIGDGELRDDLVAYVHKLNLASFVHFLGWQSDLFSVYSDLDVVALTSHNEGTPVSLIEAMASGKAVVATDVGGVKDLLGTAVVSALKPAGNFTICERGILVESNDSGSFAMAITTILRSGALRNQIGQAGRNFVRTVFTKERLIRDIDSLYEGLLCT